MPDIASGKESITIIRSISLTIYGTPKQLYAAFRRFVSPSSLVPSINADEPDEIVIPPISEANKLPFTRMSTAQDNREVL